MILDILESTSTIICSRFIFRTYSGFANWIKMLPDITPLKSPQIT